MSESKKIREDITHITARVGKRRNRRSANADLSPEAIAEREKQMGLPPLKTPHSFGAPGKDGIQHCCLCGAIRLPLGTVFPNPAPLPAGFQKAPCA